MIRPNVSCALALVLLALANATCGMRPAVAASTALRDAFASGAQKATLAGSVTAASPHVYNVKAYRGQTLTVTVVRKESGVKDVAVTFEGATLGSIARVGTFSVKFSESNFYALVVTGSGASRSAYVPKLTLSGKKPAQAESHAFED